MNAVERPAQSSSMDNFSNSQLVRKQVVAARGGVVAAQHRRAAEVGAAVLETGGDAVDAAVATSFAIGVVEPWMSGPAAGGCMVLWRADGSRAHVVDYGMRSPRALDPADYPLTGDGKVSRLFPWPTVVGDRNVQGATAVAVPGVVAGMGAAHRAFGRRPWRDLVLPAAQLARQGLIVDWYSALLTASAARALSLDPEAAAMFLEEGRWPVMSGWTTTLQRHLDQKTLAGTLEQIAEEGPDVFYRGGLARMLVRDVQAKGGCLSEEDMASYRAEVVEPLVIAYRSGRIFAAPGLTGGPTLAAVLSQLSHEYTPRERNPGPAAYSATARALHSAFATRLKVMGDHEAPEAPACTTHFCVVDRHGNMCSVTQTLLSIFGSRVVSPSTGVLLNNGVMWFDPEAGRPNSIGPDKRCLANYCPIVAEAGDGRRFAIGASGGRKIVGAVLQLTQFMIDHGMSLEEAFHQPRIDVSDDHREMLADEKLPPSVVDALRAQFPLVTTRRHVFPYAFACPSGVMREHDLNMGCTEVMSPWGDAVAERLSG
jgi:gamma-glutamyltranspeptidase/glutathione hydrolase